MALTLKHAFQSAKADGADSTLVQPSNWNAQHTLTGSNNVLFGTNGTGTGGEITITSPLTLSTSALALTIGSAGGVQAWDADLDAIAALAGTSGLLKKTAANTWTLDTTSYLSGSISLTTGVTGTLPVANGGSGVATLTGILKGNGTSAFTAATAGTDYVAPGGTAGAITATGLKETKTAPAISSGTLTLDCSAGNVFAVSLNANITTLSFTNVPASGTAYGLTLSLTADGTARTVTWGSAVKWPGGTAPTLTSTSTKVDTFVLTTWDGGTTWYAFTAGQSS